MHVLSIRKIKEHRLMLSAISVFMTLYLAKITQISPVYFVYLLMAPLWLLYIIFSLNVRLPVDVLFAINLLLLVTASSHAFILSGEYVNLFIGITVYVYVRSLRFKLSAAYWGTLAKSMANWGILFLSADTIYRLANPTMPTLEGFAAVENDANLWFYPYKFGGLMFADSNTTGLVAMIILFLLLGSRFALGIRRLRWDALALIVLVFLSFSRSAIIATFFAMIIVSMKYFNQRQKIIFGWFILYPGMLITALAILWLFMPDGSLASKFYILNLLNQHITSSSPMTLLFGIGLGNSIDLFGIHTHILFVTYFVEGGLISLLSFIVFLWAYVRRYDHVIILPVLIASTSYFLYLGTPFLFAPLAIYANIKDASNYKKINNILPMKWRAPK